MHDVVHVPFVHTTGHGAPLFCQLPDMLHVCGWEPLHCIAPGEQAPVQLPMLHT